LKKTPFGLIFVAVFQFIPIFLMPISTLKVLNPAIPSVIAALFAVLGVFLLLRRGWSRVASIFLQGMNILARILIGLNNVVRPAEAGGGLNVEMIATFAVSIVLSALVLFYIDQPDVQVLMQS